MSSIATLPAPRSSSGIRAAGVAVTAAAIAGLGTVAVAAIGKAAGAPGSARQLHVGTYLPLVIIGVFAGAISWRLISNRATNPGVVLQRLVPTVIVLSLIPDLLLHASGAVWSTVVTLMAMHLTVAAVAVSLFAILIPPAIAGATSTKEFS